jgi:hypothetical protein
MPNKFVFPGRRARSRRRRRSLDAPLEPEMRRKLAALPVTETVPAPEAMVAARSANCGRRPG